MLTQRPVLRCHRRLTSELPGSAPRHECADRRVSLDAVLPNMKNSSVALGAGLVASSDGAAARSEDAAAGAGA